MRLPFLILLAATPLSFAADPPVKAKTFAPKKLGVSGDTTVAEYRPVMLAPADAPEGSVHTTCLQVLPRMTCTIVFWDT